MSEIYSLIIVDDELIARKTLEDYVNDFCDDFEIAGIFSDGVQACEFLKNNHADVVFTDVKMPKMSGIELTKYIYENNIDTKVIIISGYSEFKYAQEALKYGAVDYLLKIVGEDEFLAVMDKLRRLLKKDGKDSADDRGIDYSIFFYDLFGGFFETKSSMKSAYEALESGIEYENAVCETALLEIENIEEFMDNSWHYGRDIFDETMTNFIKMLNTQCRVICLNSQVNNLTFVLLKDKDAPETKTDVIAYEMNNVFGLRAYVKEKCRMTLSEIYDGDMQKFLNISEKKKIFRSHQAAKSKKSRIDSVEKIMKYIAENYSKNISTAEIADSVDLSVNYAGKMFKEATGKSIPEYLLNYRMKKAKKMLENGAKLDTVCQSVGYFDKRYFRRIFKQYYGMSVGDYVKSLM